MPLFKFSGHTTEGFALNWSEASPGLLATGDCAKNIHTWKPTDDGSWSVDSRYFKTLFQLFYRKNSIFYLPPFNKNIYLILTHLDLLLDILHPSKIFSGHQMKLQ